MFPLPSRVISNQLSLYVYLMHTSEISFRVVEKEDISMVELVKGIVTGVFTCSAAWVQRSFFCCTGCEYLLVKEAKILYGLEEGYGARDDIKNAHLSFYKNLCKFNSSCEGVHKEICETVARRIIALREEPWSEDKKEAFETLFSSSVGAKKRKENVDDLLNSMFGHPFLSLEDELRAHKFNVESNFLSTGKKISQSKINKSRVYELLVRMQLDLKLERLSGLSGKADVYKEMILILDELLLGISFDDLQPKLYELEQSADLFVSLWATRLRRLLVDPCYSLILEECLAVSSDKEHSL